MTARLLETASAVVPAAPGAAPAGDPAAPPAALRPGDTALLVARASWEGGTLSWPSREDLEKALQGQALVLEEVPAPEGVATLALASGGTQEARAWRVQLLVPPGEKELPAIPVKLQAEGEEAAAAEIPGPVVTVATVLDEPVARRLDEVQAQPEAVKAVAAEALAPARGPWELAPRFPWWAWALLILLAVLVLAALARRAFRRITAPSPPPPLEPAEVVARRRLRELRESALLTTGRHLEFHVAVADILKQYLERRLDADLREMTTDEVRRLFNGRLRSTRHVPEIRQDVLAVLGACDMVKFAKVAPMPSEALAHLETVERLVTRTTEAAPAPSPAPAAGPSGKEAA